MDEKSQKLIEALALKLGVTVDHLWAVLVYQAYVAFWAEMIQWAICIAIFIVYAKYARTMFDKVRGSASCDRLDWLMLFVCTSAFTLVMFLTAFFSIEGTITKIANPEYYALEKIMAGAKGN